jgi:hypothetical protein|tara:strand:- start:1667 stop:3406 length:1740 start_codon:yes stop_codon:yes gene_type:complete
MADDYKSMGSVEFGMSLLGQTKKDVERERKRREKIDRNLALGKFVTSGLSSYVTEQFNAFEQSQQYKKAKLLDIANGKTEYDNVQNVIDNSFAGNSMDYWTNFYRTQLTREFGEGGMYSNYELTAPAQAFLVKQAQELATKRNSEWQNLGKKYAQMPTDIAKLEERWSDWVEEKAPSNVFNWATRGLKNLFNGKTQQDMQKIGEDELAIRFKEFGDADVAQRAYDKLSNSENFLEMFEAVERAYKEQDNEIGFKVLRESKPEFVSYKVPVQGGTATKQFMRTTVKRNGRYEVRNIELGTTDFKPKKEIEYSTTDYNRISDTVKSLVQGDDDFTTIADDLRIDDGKNLKLPTNIAQEILEVSESFKSYFGSKTAAETYATQYVLTERNNNNNQPVNTQVGKFAIYPYTKNLEGLDSNQLNQVFLDITGTEGVGGLLEEIDYINTNFDSQYKDNAYQFFTNVVDLANVNEDEKIEAINSLNNIFYPNKNALEITKEKVELESILENIPKNSVQVSGFKNIKTFNFLEDSYYVVFNPLRNNYKAYDINDGSYRGVITDSNALKLIEKNKNKKQKDLLASFNK